MKKQFDDIVASIGKIVLGKEQQVRLALTCLFAGGHLLIEDLPGIGKTTLAKVLSRCLGLQFRRIQFTSDMLPGDILGTSIFEQKTGRFVFHPGPIFTQVLLTDEVNRATPKTQSALLESMEEMRVTVEGETHLLPEPWDLRLLFGAYVLDHILFALRVARTTYLKKIVDHPSEITPTISMGITIDHAVAMTLPIFSSPVGL